jgi:hypothetical protein
MATGPPCSSPSGPGVAAQPGGHGPRTYHSYYEDADNDPYGGQYGSIVADFTVPVAPAAGALAPQELAARVYASRPNSPERQIPSDQKSNLKMPIKTRTLHLVDLRVHTFGNDVSRKSVGSSIQELHLVLSRIC